MAEVNQDFEPLLDYLVRLLSRYVRDQPHTAGSVLELRVIEALLLQIRDIPLRRALLGHGCNLEGGSGGRRRPRPAAGAIL